MCDYCEKSTPLGEFIAIKEGRTFNGEVYIVLDRIHMDMRDCDGGLDDRDYSFTTNGVRINYCPVCGRELKL